MAQRGDWGNNGKTKNNKKTAKRDRKGGKKTPDIDGGGVVADYCDCRLLLVAQKTHYSYPVFRRDYSARNG